MVSERPPGGPRGLSPPRGGGRMNRRVFLAEKGKPQDNPDREIPYLLCKECGVPCYVFETEMGAIREALCIACGNEKVSMFLRGEWDDVEED